MICQFPECGFKPSAKHQLHNHHILPKELGGKNQRWNKIKLCPTCHNRIYVPEATSGIHSMEAANSIILIGYKNNGLILEYIENGQTEFASL